MWETGDDLPFPDFTGSQVQSVISNPQQILIPTVLCKANLYLRVYDNVIY